MVERTRGPSSSSFGACPAAVIGQKSEAVAWAHRRFTRGAYEAEELLGELSPKMA